MDDNTDLVSRDFWLSDDGALPQWIIKPNLMPYDMAVSAMEAHIASMHQDKAAEAIWLVEHPSLYTAGVSARDEDLIAPNRFKVHKTSRGGQFTYHGPGQRVVYVMLDLNRRRKDVRGFVRTLEAVIIDALSRFNVEAKLIDGKVGVFVERRDLGVDSERMEKPRSDKIAALGIKLKHWISYHGLSLNVRA